MTYELHFGDRSFSSWSLRGWLMLESFGLEFTPHFVSLYDGGMAEAMRPLSPVQLVPALRLPDGTLVGESLAMAETLAERHPEVPMWPRDPAARATARFLSAEMCAGFSGLRGNCPMQLLHVYEGFEPDAATLKDIARLETLWAHARRYAGEGAWLFGEWSLADVFYVPVAARIVGYDLPVSEVTRAMCDRMIRHEAVQAWRSEGLKTTYDPVPYAMDLGTRPWPA